MSFRDLFGRESLKRFVRDELSFISALIECKAQTIMIGIEELKTESAEVKASVEALGAGVDTAIAAIVALKARAAGGVTVTMDDLDAIHGNLLSAKNAAAEDKAKLDTVDAPVEPTPA